MYNAQCNVFLFKWWTNYTSNESWSCAEHNGGKIFQPHPILLKYSHAYVIIGQIECKMLETISNLLKYRLCVYNFKVEIVVSVVVIEVVGFTCCELRIQNVNIQCIVYVSCKTPCNHVTTWTIYISTKAGGVLSLVVITDYSHTPIVLTYS